MFETYPSKSQPVNPKATRGPTSPGLKQATDPSVKQVPRTTKSPGDKIDDAHNPYFYRADVNRDEEEIMRSRPNRSDYGKRPQVEDTETEGAFPVIPQVISP